MTREVDFGLQKIRVSLPAVFTCDLRLNTPRFANVQNIIKAKKKPVETINLADLGIDVAPRLKTEKVEMPTERQGGVIVGSVDELIQKLKSDDRIRYIPDGPKRGWHLIDTCICPRCDGKGTVEKS